MRTRPQPVPAYDGERGYPSMADCSLSRRGFLRSVVAEAGAGAAALAASGVLLPHPGALAAPGQPWLKAVVQLNPPYQLQGHRYRRVDKVVLQTRSSALHRFLTTAAELRSLGTALRVALRGATVADIEDRRRLARLEAKVGDAAAAQYRARTAKRAVPPIVTLVILRMEPPSDPGFRGAPPAPVPAP